jgi:hypothetical protein
MPQLSIAGVAMLAGFVAGKGGVGGGRISENSLCSDNETGRGWQSRERKLKELKHEGHIALGK